MEILVNQGKLFIHLNLIIFDILLKILTIRNARRRPVTISYKEESEESDSDDYLDKEEVEEKEEEPLDTSETIEKVLNRRQGKKGVVGNSTTIYAIEDKGDPNVDCEINEKETQYLIKWKGWSHIHNTWESMNSLQAQKVKGLKKIDNFVKREDSICAWRDQMTPEDSEYYECQLELQQDLLKSYNIAERIIGMYPLYYNYTICSRLFYLFFNKTNYVDLYFITLIQSFLVSCIYLYILRGIQK